MRTRHPDVEVGLTGTAVVDSDETAVATLDSSIASGVALLLIAMLLIAAFHSVRLPLILVASLLIGVAWSFGWLVLSVGHLQILSVTFIAVLLGLGVDFGIHLDSTYEQVRGAFGPGRDEFTPALAETFRLSAPGILTGALTTAAAFVTTAFTDFKGVAEMGIIASGGVVLCLLAMFTVFPALQAITRYDVSHVARDTGRRFHVFRESWLLPVSRHPWRTLTIAFVVVGACGGAATNLRFVYDLLALQPRGVESVSWQHRIITEGDVSIYFGVSIVDDLSETAARQQAFMEKPTVSTVGGVGLLIPPDNAEKVTLLEEARSRIGAAIEFASRPPILPAGSTSTTRLTSNLATLLRAVSRATQRTDVPPPLLEALRELQGVTQSAVDGFRAITPPPQRIPRVEAVDAAWTDMRQTLAGRLDDLLDPTPLTPADLPSIIMRPYVDASDPAHPRYCLHVFPRLPDDSRIDNPLSPHFLPEFVDDITSVDPLATGVVVQIQRSGELIWSSYRQAGLTAMVVVFVLVWIGFRSIVDTVLALLPVLLGFTVTFGVMAIAEVWLNPANLMILPLLFGIGVDAGVHIVHRYRLNPDRRPLGLTFGTGKGITLTSLTTLCGFATMIFARHRGVSSLGFVMTVGLGVTTLVCWTVLPALLELRRRKQKSGNAEI